MGDSVVLAAFGLVATVVGYLIKQNSLIMAKLSSSMDRLTNRIEKSEKADRKFQETMLKQQEVAIKYLEGLDKKADRNFDAIGAQTVVEQHVGKQIIEREVRPRRSES